MIERNLRFGMVIIMTVFEAYISLGGEVTSDIYQSLSEKMLFKFLKKLTEDDQMQILEQAILEKDRDTAYAAAHTLKGVALNLAISRLSNPLCGLTDALRAGFPQNAEELFQEVKTEFDYAVKVINLIEL